MRNAKYCVFWPSIRENHNIFRCQQVRIRFNLLVRVSDSPDRNVSFLTAPNTANPYRPFCSEVCRTADLGSWASDEYVIHGEPGSAMNLSPEEYEAAAEHTREVAAKKERSRK